MDKIEDFTDTSDVSDAAIEWVLRVTNCDCFTSASVRRGAEDNYGADGARIIAARLVERHYPELLVDPLLVEAREVCAKWAEDDKPWVSADAGEKYRDGKWDDASHMAIALAALRRGMELGRSDPVRPPLTRERVGEAFAKAASLPFQRSEDYYGITIDRLHAALTASEAPDA